MFRPKTDDDITEEEFVTILSPFVDKCHEYIEKKLIPVYVAYYIAEAYNTSSLEEDTYDIFINSALCSFNIEPVNYETIKSDTTKLLEDEYHLRVISEDPLDFERIFWSYVIWQ